MERGLRFCCIIKFSPDQGLDTSPVKTCTPWARKQGQEGQESLLLPSINCLIYVLNRDEAQKRRTYWIQILSAFCGAYCRIREDRHPPCGRNASEQSTFVSLWSEPKGMMDPDSPAQCLQFHSEPLTGDLQPTHHHKMTTSHKTEQRLVFQTQRKFSLKNNLVNFLNNRNFSRLTFVHYRNFRVIWQDLPDIHVYPLHRAGANRTLFRTISGISGVPLCRYVLRRSESLSRSYGLVELTNCNSVRNEQTSPNNRLCKNKRSCWRSIL